MKFDLIIVLVCLFQFSCIKKNALKADSNLVGIWVSYDGGYNTWLLINPDGNAIYRTYDQIDNKDSKFDGIAKYSLFEKKFYVGSTKFKIITPNTGHTDGVTEVSVKSYNTLQDTIYQVDRKLTLKTSLLHRRRIINFYRAK